MSRAAISLAVKRGPLKGAVVARKIDIEHRDALAYLASHPFSRDTEGEPIIPEIFTFEVVDIPLTRARLARELGRVPTEGEVGRFWMEYVEQSGDHVQPGDRLIEHVGGLVLGQEEETYTREGLMRLEIDKKRAETRRIHLQNEHAAGQLIRRDFVSQHIFGALEQLSLRLLRDAPKTIASQLMALHHAGVPVEEAEQKVREIFSDLLQETKRKARQALKRTQNGAPTRTRTDGKDHGK
ncbi:MAG: hypothetical protein WBG86_16410 [Polyangiales bacterium]